LRTRRSSTIKVQNQFVGLLPQEDPHELTCVIDLPDEPNALSLPWAASHRSMSSHFATAAWSVV
jgi:hypothetical protein